MDTGFFFGGDDRNVLESDSGDGWTALWMYESHLFVSFQVDWPHSLAVKSARSHMADWGWNPCPGDLKNTREMCVCALNPDAEMQEKGFWCDHNPPPPHHPGKCTHLWQWKKKKG